MIPKTLPRICILIAVSLSACSTPLPTAKEAEASPRKTSITSAIKSGTIIEIVTFKLKEGVTADEFRVLDEAVESQHVSRQPGFIARKSAVNHNNEWLVIVYWHSIKDAEASMASFPNAQATAEFMDNLQADTMSMKYYTSHLVRSNYHFENVARINTARNIKIKDAIAPLYFANLARQYDRYFW